MNPLWLPLSKGEKRPRAAASMSQHRPSSPEKTDASNRPNATAPPILPGETTASNHLNVTAPRILPLCKGELEGVVGKLKVKS